MRLSQPEQVKISGLSGPLFFQPKINGIRAFWDGSNLRTRNGRAIECLPHICKEIKRNSLSHIPFDGELYARKIPFDELNGLIRRKKHIEKHLKIKFYVFDLISEDPQNIRIEQIEHLPTMNNIIKVQTIKNGNPARHYRQVLSAKYEGLIARSFNGKYAEQVYKIKPVFDDEFKIIDLYEKGIICETSKGAKFKVKTTKHGLKIGDRATIEYSALSGHGIPFHGRFKSGRYDIPNNDKDLKKEALQENKQNNILKILLHVLIVSVEFSAAIIVFIVTFLITFICSFTG